MEINLFLKYINFLHQFAHFYNVYDVSVYEYTPKMETYWWEGNNVLVDYYFPRISLDLSLERLILGFSNMFIFFDCIISIKGIVEK